MGRTVALARFRAAFRWSWTQRRAQSLMLVRWRNFLRLRSCGERRVQEAALVAVAAALLRIEEAADVARGLAAAATAAPRRSPDMSSEVLRARPRVADLLLLLSRALLSVHGRTHVTPAALRVVARARCVAQKLAAKLAAIVETSALETAGATIRGYSDVLPAKFSAAAARGAEGGASTAVDVTEVSPRVNARPTDPTGDPMGSTCFCRS